MGERVPCLICAEISEQGEDRNAVQIRTAKGGCRRTSDRRSEARRSRTLLSAKEKSPLIGLFLRLIGQKALIKTAVVIDISIVAAVLSFLKEDIGWTKSVDENAEIC